MTGLMVFQELGAQSALHTAETVTGKMRQRLDGVRTLEARYSVSTYAAVLDQRNITEGRLYLKRDENRLRLEEASQTIVSDGESMWTYVPANRQVIVSPARDDASGTQPGRPDDFIFNYSNRYRYELEGRDPVDGTPGYLLSLTAIDPAERIPTLRIWVDAETWLTKKVKYADDMGSETILRFKDYQLNAKLDPGLFRMTTPDDVEWVDLR